ncbi:MAG: hypothetical protein HY696_00445 [Deltaproteobacteria bacterium]|nr:hypothetical protein [Deltaproteobacteria bacterium]
MKHAFCLHYTAAERTLARTTLETLQRYWGSASEWYVVLDATATEDDATFAAARATALLQSKAADAAWCHGLNAGVRLAAERGIEVLSWLRPGMIPCCAATWSDFLTRFRDSGRAVSFCPVAVHGSIPELSSLHVAPQQAMAARWFPLAAPPPPEADPPSAGAGRGEAGLHLAQCWSRHAWSWMAETYLLWSMTLAPHGAWGLTAGRCFSVERYYPETSMIVTKDSWFWAQYENVVNRRCYGIDR